MYVILFWIFGTWRAQSSLSFMAHFASLCEGTCPIVNREIPAHSQAAQGGTCGLSWIPPHLFSLGWKVHEKLHGNP